jgi:hypothetical protein
MGLGTLTHPKVFILNKEFNMSRYRDYDGLKFVTVFAFAVLLAWGCRAVEAGEPSLVAGTKPLVERLKGITKITMAGKFEGGKEYKTSIFVEGYNQRAILALYEITGEKHYLEHVRKWVHKLLDLQLPEGYWGTGYGDVYFADTGSALGLFVNFYKFATPEEQKRIDAALERYIHLLVVKGDTTGTSFVHEDGSIGCGFGADKQGKITGNLNLPYTIATGLTGAEIFAAWHYMKGNPRDKQIAIKACGWMLTSMVGEVPIDDMSQPGQIPYIFYDSTNPAYAGHTSKMQGRPLTWKQWPYDTSAYAGEGFISAWTYIDDKEFRQDLGRRIKPHIEWLLRTQNEDGSWAKKKSPDQLRSHGVVDLLQWYHNNVDRDPRVAQAVRRYADLLADPVRSAYLTEHPIGLCLAGRAIATIIRPGVDCNRWKDSAK